MSVSCGIECVVCIGCTRWAWKRCTYIGNDDSKTWTCATYEEFEPIPRICRVILAVYEEDLRNPKYPPSGGYRMNPDWVVKRVTYSDTRVQAPPYLIYIDHDARDIVLAIRGLNLVKESDYKVLLDNRLGMQMFDGGFVHHGLLKSATWLLNQESETLRELVERHPGYTLTFSGHSLGSGIAALLTILVVNNRESIGGIDRSKVRCYAVAPARCMSLNLAVKYADVIHSVLLQDDFLPRTATPLEDIFKSIFCLPCLLVFVCLRDTCIPESRMLRDPRRLYAPGRIYHMVERRFCRCGRYPPEVKTAIPVEGRFDHIVLSCNATSDHGIIWIERESQKALDLMTERMTKTTAPPPQRIERLQTIEKEHKDALERAVSLNVPHAISPMEDQDNNMETMTSQTDGETSSRSGPKRTNWDEVVQKLFQKDKSGKLSLKKDISAD
ncbi:hypothetical protein AMTR_s00010p00164460 [Amborella trichopoda]|uniref:Fungal lipase-like domain-containing protein n=1 Tax=Amborella trichopoda TaxID=13333 RepID=W1NFA3_AMBTC|nr:hypothetical protein AMTR_s00010p00164460 [Amborella trichopoda]